MKKKLLLSLLFLFTFSLNIILVNAASYVDTEHGVTCMYSPTSTVTNLILADDGTITQTSTGTKDDTLAGATIKVTFHDKKKVSDYNFNDDENIEEFASFSVVNPKGAKIKIDNKSKFTAFKVKKGYALERYNALRTCDNMYFVYYKVGNTYHIINMLKWQYAGVGTAAGSQEVELNKTLDGAKGNICYMQSDAYREKVCMYADEQGGSKLARLVVDIKYDKKWIFESKLYGPGLTEGKNTDGTVTSVNSLSNFKCTAYVNNVKTTAPAYNCASKLYYFYDTGFKKWYVVNSKPSKSNVRTLVLVNNYQFYEPRNQYKMILATYGDIKKNDNSENRVPTAETTEKQIEDYCGEHPNDSACKSFCDNHKDLAACKKLSFKTYTFKFCEDKGILKSLKIVHNLLVIAKILVPLILIVVGSIDFGKATLSGNDSDLEKVTHSFITKLIVGLIIFMIPTIVDSVVRLAQSNKDVKDVKTGEFSKCAACFSGLKTCDTYISNGKD